MELGGWTSPQMLRRYGARARGTRARRSYDRIHRPHHLTRRKSPLSFCSEARRRYATHASWEPSYARADARGQGPVSVVDAEQRACHPWGCHHQGGQTVLGFTHMAPLCVKRGHSRPG
jgi:hypothetical protein